MTYATYVTYVTHLTYVTLGSYTHVGVSMTGYWLEEEEDEKKEEEEEKMTSLLDLGRLRRPR